MQNLDDLINKISSHPLFLKQKNVVENIKGWHDHEDVFSHSVKTANIAKKERSGQFITNPKTRELFIKWMEEDVFGMRRRDIAVIIALLHDCGKILSFKENGKTSTLITQNPFDSLQTMCPGHEYWGGEIVVAKILKDSGLDEKIIEYIGKVTKQHGLFSAGYYIGKEKWSKDELLNDVKTRAEGLYKESLFNMYCDGYTSPAFSQGKARVEELFNMPLFYAPREYFIP